MNLTKPISSNPPATRFTACHRYPGEPVTGFCAPCLSERLAGLDPAGVKSIVEKGQCSNSANSLKLNELSRSKSCSGHNGSKRNGVALTTVEPRRKSCDVRGRSSLSTLFVMDDGVGKGGSFMNNLRNEEVGVGEIRVLEEIQICGDGDEEWRTMKEHIDLECRSKKESKGKDLKNIAGSIWIAAASGFSKKLQKWKHKQKLRMERSNGNGNLNRVAVAMDVERMNMNVREWRETRSEVGDYGFGRRSCDTEPRFSVDAGRASVDCARFSLDEGRASWDGYLIGRSLVHRPNQMNQMLAVVEDDDRYVEDVISVRSGNGFDKSPGGSEQTRDYYGEGLTRRRRSLDRSSSNRRASSVELEELRAISNSRISPATVELFHGAKVLLTKNDVKLPNLSPIKTERVESSDSASVGPSSILEEGNGNSKLQVKKLAGWRKAWTNWGSSQKLTETKYKFACEEDEAESKAAEKVTSSGTHVTSSSSSSISGSFMKSSTETKGLRIKRLEQPLALERNRSTRYSPSPNNHDNGLLRFYLTPSRGIRGGKCSKSRLQSSQDVARNALRL